MNSITVEKLKAAYEATKPVMFYVTSPEIPRGQSLLVAARPDFGSPAYFICHPDDLDEIRAGVPGTRFVHLRDAAV